MEFSKEKLEKSVLKKVGSFRIFQDIKLGSGTFGVVYLSSLYTPNEISLTDTFYAAKAINKKVIDPKRLAEFEEKIITEIVILKQLDHLNIVKLIDVRSTDNNYYLILELCKGGTLESYRRKKDNKRLTETEALDIIRQIASAMIYCNQKEPPIIHRDLKPANILLHDGQVKVSDFGFARLVQNSYDKLKLTTNIGRLIYALNTII